MSYIKTKINTTIRNISFNQVKASNSLNQNIERDEEIYNNERNCGARHTISTKERAISMRREGKTYGEILELIPVAKSTLSLWLREVGLSIPQKQRITKLRKQAQQKGARVRHEMAVEKRDGIYDISREQIGNLTDREVWLLAIMAYWAEGAKEKMYSGSQFKFGNMDPRMIRLLLYWLINVHKLVLSDIKFEIYLHENNKQRLQIVKEYWSKELNIPLSLLGVVRYKNNKIKTKRKNVGDLYYGLIQVKVVASSTLVRQIEGWVQGADAFIKNKIMRST